MTPAEERYLLGKMFDYLDAKDPRHPIHDVPSFVQGFSTALIMARQIEVLDAPAPSND